MVNYNFLRNFDNIIFRLKSKEKSIAFQEEMSF